MEKNKYNISKENKDQNRHLKFFNENSKGINSICAILTTIIAAVSFLFVIPNKIDTVQKNANEKSVDMYAYRKVIFTFADVHNAHSITQVEAQIANKDNNNAPYVLYNAIKKSKGE